MRGNPLTIFLCRCAAKLFVGRHDFTQFSSIPAVTQPISPVKFLYKMEVVESEGDLRISMLGSGFLYNQCRHMVGCLIAIGLGRLSDLDVARLLGVGSKERPGANAVILCSLPCI